LELLALLKGQPNRQDIRDKLIRGNIKLVVWAASQVFKNIPIEEKLTAGMVGLNDAVAVFDPAKGAFSTIATQYIQGRVRRYMNETHGTIYIPEAVQRAGLRLGYTTIYTGEEDESGFKVGVDLPDETNTGDVLSTQDLETYKARWLEGALTKLKPLWADVIKLRTQGLPQREIAKRLGNTRSDVSRLETKATRKLAKMWREHLNGFDKS
jgi:RNA polymerase sigma factor (sigma-70 family)